MDSITQLRQGLQAPRAPEELMRTLHGLHAAGITQEEAYEALETLLAEAQQSLGVEQISVLSAAMDVVCGWCLPESRIWSEEIPRRHVSESAPQPV